MYRLQNPRRGYDWGSTTLIQQLAGIPIDGSRLAEIWMGAHPDAPSTAVCAGRSESLDDLIVRFPDEMLGEKVRARFGTRLPFLAKILAAAKGLSIQVHPSSAQAQSGFARENALGISLDDPRRTYRDSSHKPEMLYALTPMELLSGLREPEQAAKLVEALAIEDLTELVDCLRSGSDAAQSMRAAFEWLLSQRQDSGWVALVRENTEVMRWGRPEMKAVYELTGQFPNDPGVIAPLLMNYEQIRPGQVIFTGAGTLHAYLRGMAIEVMGASDNVLRAALTSKYVDTEAVLSIGDYRPGLADFLVGATQGSGRQDYTVDGIEDFALSLLTVCGGDEAVGPESGPRIAVCTQGSVELSGTDVVELGPGDSAFIPNIDGPVTVCGNGTVAIVYVP